MGGRQGSEVGEPAGSGLRDMKVGDLEGGHWEDRWLLVSGNASHRDLEGSSWQRWSRL